MEHPGRYERAAQRKQKKQQVEIAESLLQLSSTLPEPEVDPDTASCTFLLRGKLEHPDQQTGDPEPAVDNEIGPLIREELNRLTVENLDLKEKLKENDITPDFFEGNDERVKYYTGLPSFLTLMTIFNFLEPFLPGSGRTALTKFQKLVLVLMKLRLNLPVQDLAYRFNVSKSTVSRTFLTVIHVMYIRMKSLIIWPGREELRLTMPMEFRKYFGLKVVVIIYIVLRFSLRDPQISLPGQVRGHHTSTIIRSNF